MFDPLSTVFEFLDPAASSPNWEPGIYEEIYYADEDLPTEIAIRAATDVQVHPALEHPDQGESAADGCSSG